MSTFVINLASKLESDKINKFETNAFTIELSNDFSQCENFIYKFYKVIFDAFFEIYENFLNNGIESKPEIWIAFCDSINAKNAIYPCVNFSNSIPFDYNDFVTNFVTNHMQYDKKSSNSNAIASFKTYGNNFLNYLPRDHFSNLYKKTLKKISPPSHYRNIEYSFNVQLNNDLIKVDTQIRELDYEQNLSRHFSTDGTEENKYKIKLEGWLNYFAQFIKQNNAAVDIETGSIIEFNKNALDKFLEDNFDNDKNIANTFIIPNDINITAFKHLINNECKNRLQINIQHLYGSKIISDPNYGYIELNINYTNTDKNLSPNNVEQYVFICRNGNFLHRQNYEIPIIITIDNINIWQDSNFYYFCRFPPIIWNIIGGTLAFVGTMLNIFSPNPNMYKNYYCIVAALIFLVYCMSFFFDLSTRQIELTDNVFEKEYFDNNLHWFKFFNLEYRVEYSSNNIKFKKQYDKLKKSIDNKEFIEKELESKKKELVVLNQKSLPYKNTIILSECAHERRTIGQILRFISFMGFTSKIYYDKNSRKTCGYEPLKNIEDGSNDFYSTKSITYV
jgi:hypothetical protein